MTRAYLTGVVLVTLVGALNAGEVYRWVDEQGKVHFGDRPAGEDAESIVVKPAVPPTPDEAVRRERQRRALHMFEEERRLKEQREAKSAQEARQRRQACEAARRRLETYERGGRLFEIDESGQRSFLSDAEIDSGRDYWRGQVERWCN